jgi:DNA-binding CsgD family transcriptional regulator
MLSQDQIRPDRRGSSKRTWESYPRVSAPSDRHDLFAEEALNLVFSLLSSDTGCFFLIDHQMRRRGFRCVNMTEAVARNLLGDRFVSDELGSDAIRLAVPRQKPEQGTTSLRPGGGLDPSDASLFEMILRDRGTPVAGLCVMPSSREIVAQRWHNLACIQPFMEYSFNQFARSVSDGELASRFELTDKEIEVFRLICVGRTNSEIAANLRISLSTVKCHILHIFNKVGVGNRIALIAAITRSATLANRSA